MLRILMALATLACIVMPLSQKQNAFAHADDYRELSSAGAESLRNYVGETKIDVHHPTDRFVGYQIDMMDRKHFNVRVFDQDAGKRQLFEYSCSIVNRSAKGLCSQPERSYVEGARLKIGRHSFMQIVSLMSTVIEDSSEWFSTRTHSVKLWQHDGRIYARVTTSTLRGGKRTFQFMCRVRESERVCDRTDTVEGEP